jgi:hypothetical protein
MQSNAIPEARNARLHSEIGHLFRHPDSSIHFGDGCVSGLVSACLKVSIENNESHGQGDTYELTCSQHKA